MFYAIWWRSNCLDFDKFVAQLVYISLSLNCFCRWYRAGSTRARAGSEKGIQELWPGHRPWSMYNQAELQTRET